MMTQIDDAAPHALIARFYERGRPATVICHGACTLLQVRMPTGDVRVIGKTSTGFANSEEDYADRLEGKPIQPSCIETEARTIADTDFVVASAFAPFAIRHGMLMTSQQQNSGAAAAREIIAAVGRWPS